MTARASFTFEDVAGELTDSFVNPTTHAMYGKAIRDFLVWYTNQGAPSVNRSLLEAHRDLLQQEGYSSATVNQRLCAIRRLVIFAAEKGLLTPEEALLSTQLSGLKRSQVRRRGPLSTDQTDRLVGAPELTSVKGIRDRAILALLLTGGLGRSEITALQVSQMRRVDGRWELVDIEGKGGRLRTVTIPDWAKAAVDLWMRTGSIEQGTVFRMVHRNGNIATRGLSPQAIFDIVLLYSNRTGLNIRPQDLRRTWTDMFNSVMGDPARMRMFLGFGTREKERDLSAVAYAPERSSERIPPHREHRNKKAS
jgi:site-specific recombinase XerD